MCEYGEEDAVHAGAIEVAKDRALVDWSDWKREHP